MADDERSPDSSVEPAAPGTGAATPTAASRGSALLRRGLPVAVLVVVLAAAPLFLAPFATTTLSRILVFALFAVSLDLLVGVTGLPSLGHAAYFGVGAYAAGWVSINWTSEAPVPLLVAAAPGPWPPRHRLDRGAQRRRLLPDADPRHRRVPPSWPAADLGDRAGPTASPASRPSGSAANR